LPYNYRIVKYYYNNIKLFTKKINKKYYIYNKLIK
jgi:hypothetical protein